MVAVISLVGYRFFDPSDTPHSAGPSCSRRIERMAALACSVVASIAIVCPSIKPSSRFGTRDRVASGGLLSQREFVDFGVTEPTGTIRRSRERGGYCPWKHQGSNPVVSASARQQVPTLIVQTASWWSAKPSLKRYTNCFLAPKNSKKTASRWHRPEHLAA